MVGRDHQYTIIAPTLSVSSSGASELGASEHVVLLPIRSDAAKRCQLPRWLSKCAALWLALIAAALVALVVWSAQWRDALRDAPVSKTWDFHDEFDSLDRSVWAVERSLDDGGNGEFQAYTDDPAVIFTRDGKLVVQPKPMDADSWSWLADFDGAIDRGSMSPEEAHDVRAALEQPGGVDFALSGQQLELDVARCTDADQSSRKCKSKGYWDNPLPPVVSARLSTKGQYALTYGRVECRLRVPVGDWLWPALWLLPAAEHAAPWPRSGEIDLLEARGNSPAFKVAGSDQSGFGGNDRIAATAHCASAGGQDDFVMRNTSLTDGLLDEHGFLVIGVERSPGYVRTYALQNDGRERTLTESPKGGPKCAQQLQKQQQHESETNAPHPFDQPFYLIINVAVGGAVGGGVPYWGTNALWHGCAPPNCAPGTLFKQRQDEWLPTWMRPLEVDWIRATKETYHEKPRPE